MRPNLQHTLDVRRAEVKRVDDVGGDFVHVFGRAKLLGVGQGIFTVNFPVAFTSRPYPSICHELEQGHAFDASNVVQFTPTIVRWGEKAQDSGILTLSADVGVVLSGSSDLESYAVFHFYGSALKSPIASSMRPEAQI